MIDQPDLSSSLAPTPKHPDEDPELIARVAADGFKVTPRAEREAEWHRDHPGPKRPAPRLARLGRDLEPHLVVLERHSMGCTRELYAFDQPRDLAEAIVAIAVRAPGAVLTRQKVVPNELPGVDVQLSTGWTRTDQADTLVGRIDLWLRSDLGRNLVKSLANEAQGTEYHAVLVFDAQTEPEYQAATEQGLDFCPTQDLELPDAIDVLWFILGPVAARYRPDKGWDTRPMPTSA